MGKSLTETAKAVLQGQTQIQEEMNTALGGNPITKTGAVTPNMATLRPGSKSVDGQIVNPGANSTTGNQAQDLGGATPTATAKENLGAKAAGATKKDTSRSSQAAVPAEKAKKQAEVMEEDLEQEEANVVSESEEIEEDIEISEELESFIDQLVAEGLSEDEIAQAVAENFEFVTEEEEAAEYTVDMSEHVDALLEGEELSEEFKAKATTIFEAAVKQKVEEEIARLEQAYLETLEEQVQDITEQLSENVDDYLNYVVETWMNDNEIAIEAGLRTELTEDFISGLRNLFAENYIDMPEDKVSVVEELAAKVSELEGKLNEEIENNVALTKMLSESKKIEAVNSIVEGLTATQAEKLKALAEGIEFTSVEQYQEKLETLKESYFPTSVKTENVLDKVESSEGTQMISEDTRMSKYVQVLGRQSK